MYNRVHYFGSILLFCLLVYFAKVVLTEIFEDESAQVDEWLDQNELGEYKKMFREYGELLSFSSLLDSGQLISYIFAAKLSNFSMLVTVKEDINLFQ